MLVAGWIEPQLRVMWREAGAENPGLRIAYTLDQAALDLHRREDRPIFVLRGLEGHNFEVEGVRLEGPGIAPF